MGDHEVLPNEDRVLCIDSGDWDAFWIVGDLTGCMLVRASEVDPGEREIWKVLEFTHRCGY